MRYTEEAYKRARVTLASLTMLRTAIDQVRAQWSREDVALVDRMIKEARQTVSDLIKARGTADS